MYLTSTDSYHYSFSRTFAEFKVYKYKKSKIFTLRIFIICKYLVLIEVTKNWNNELHVLLKINNKFCTKFAYAVLFIIRDIIETLLYIEKQNKIVIVEVARYK